MSCKIIESMGYVKSQVYKMDLAIDLAYICMISRLPMLFIGNPGTGKSHTSKIIASMFGDRDKDWFYQSITAKTSPEKIFGGLIAEKMLQGIEEYNLDAGAASKDGVIFDELYKSQHPAMMNALLNFYDENPTIFSGGKNINVGWHWGFNTTNFEDISELDLRYDPLWDRQGAKFRVNNLNKDDSKTALLMALKQKAKPVNPPQIAIADLEKARKSAMEFEISDSCINVFYDRILPILEKYCYISQRKINSLFVGKKGHPSILQSAAYITHASGDKIIISDLLEIVPFFAWQDLRKYDNLIAEVKAAVIPPAVKVYKEIERIYTDFQADINNGKFKSNTAADQALHTAQSAIKVKLGAVSESDKKQVSPQLKKRLSDLSIQCKEMVDNMAAKVLDTVMF